jgi:hypothetical protein
MGTEQVQVDQEEAGYVLATRKRQDYQIHRGTRAKISGPFEMLEYLRPNPDDLPPHPV